MDDKTSRRVVFLPPEEASYVDAHKGVMTDSQFFRTLLREKMSRPVPSPSVEVTGEWKRLGESLGEKP